MTEDYIKTSKRLFKIIKDAIIYLKDRRCPLCGETYHTGMSCMSCWCENPECKWFKETNEGRTCSVDLFPWEMRTLLQCIYEMAVDGE